MSSHSEKLHRVNGLWNARIAWEKLEHYKNMCNLVNIDQPIILHFFSSKTAWKWKNLDSKEGRASLRSTTGKNCPYVKAKQRLPHCHQREQPTEPDLPVLIWLTCERDKGDHEIKSCRFNMSLSSLLTVIDARDYKGHSSFPVITDSWQCCHFWK